MNQASMSFILVPLVAMDQMGMQGTAPEVPRRCSFILCILLEFHNLEASARTFLESLPNKQTVAINSLPHSSPC